jgi:hypothetical protein
MVMVLMGPLCKTYSTGNVVNWYGNDAINVLDGLIHDN